MDLGPEIPLIVYLLLFFRLLPPVILSSFISRAFGCQYCVQLYQLNLIVSDHISVTPNSPTVSPFQHLTPHNISPPSLQGLLNPALATACELLSTPSLLAGSFTDPLGPIQVDIEGVEACYIAIIQMGKVTADHRWRPTVGLYHRSLD
jgi:hypothetical protein